MRVEYNYYLQLFIRKKKNAIRTILKTDIPKTFINMLKKIFFLLIIIHLEKVKKKIFRTFFTFIKDRKPVTKLLFFKL